MIIMKFEVIPFEVIPDTPFRIPDKPLAACRYCGACRLCGLRLRINLGESDFTIALFSVDLTVRFCRNECNLL